MKKSELKSLIKHELNSLLKEDLDKLTPKELAAAKAHFDPIVKKHGGKIIRYFKSMGDLAIEIQSYRVLVSSVVIAQAMSKKDAQNIINAIKENDAKLLTSPDDNVVRMSPDTTFLYWKQ